jgi:hypothetical protein
LTALSLRSDSTNGKKRKFRLALAFASNYSKKRGSNRLLEW